MKVAKLKRYAARGDKGELLDEVRLVTDYGLEGNYIGGGLKQICLQSEEAQNWMNEQTTRGLCFERFNENILISGLDSSLLPIGTLLSIGEATLKVTASKPCFDECILHSNNLLCRLSSDAKFLSVVEGGLVKVGDTLSILD